MYLFKLSGITAIFLLLISCAKEENYDIELYVDAEMIPYFERFQNEGQLRGIEVDFANAGITALFDNLDNSIAGQCTTQNTGSREIKVDSRYWRRANGTDRELVIFHELGHCYLSRSHLDDSNTNGICISLMNSGLGKCTDNYSSATRDDYLDELFVQ